jgi:hypothetical protein
MFGMPYKAELISNLHALGAERAPDSVRAARPEHGLWGLFGAIPLGIYRQATASLRQGFLRLPQGNVLPAPDNFLQLERLTLVTGHENQLWHRASIDWMYEWLRRNLGPDDRRVQKRVFPKLGHQDLFWCEDSALRETVYKTLYQGLSA